MRRRSTWVALCAVIFALGGCSGSDDSEEGSPPETTEVDLARFDTTDVAELLRAEPGRMDPEKDRESIVAALAEDIDDGVQGPELFHTLLDLGAGDYRTFQEYLDTFEMDFSETSDRPDGALLAGSPGGDTLNVQVLFDASSSMRGRVDGSPKIDLAKDAVRDFVAELPDGANVSLRAYGHTGSNQEEDKAESCATTEAVYPLGPFDAAAFGDALGAFEPTGFTPIARAIEDAKDELDDQDDEAANVVYVVSDGEETCGGDPVEAAEQLADSDVQAVVNIIGFDVKDAEQRALRDIAEAGNGQYHRADSGDELKRLLRDQIRELRRQWGEWRDENRATIGQERDDARKQAAELRDAGRELAGEERERLRAIADDLEELRDHDAMALRSAIQTRAMSIRSHLWSEFTRIRGEVWTEGTQRRGELWQEGTEERGRLHQEMLER